MSARSYLHCLPVAQKMLACISAGAAAIGIDRQHSCAGFEQANTSPGKRSPNPSGEEFPGSAQDCEARRTGHELGRVALTRAAKGKGILAADETVAILTKHFDARSRGDAAQAHHGHCRQGVRSPGRQRGWGRDASLRASTRGGARHPCFVGRQIQALPARVSTQSTGCRARNPGC